MKIHWWKPTNWCQNGIFLFFLPWFSYYSKGHKLVSKMEFFISFFNNNWRFFNARIVHARHFDEVKTHLMNRLEASSKRSIFIEYFLFRNMLKYVEKRIKHVTLDFVNIFEICIEKNAKMEIWDVITGFLTKEIPFLAIWTPFFLAIWVCIILGYCSARFRRFLAISINFILIYKHTQNGM